MTAIDIYDRGRWDYLQLSLDEEGITINYHFKEGDYPETICANKTDAIRIAKEILSYYGEKL